MRPSDLSVIAVFLLSAPLIAGVLFEVALSVDQWSRARIGSAPPFGFALGLEPRNYTQHFLNFASPNYVSFGLPSLVAGLLVVRKARNLAAPASLRYGFDAAALAYVIQSAIVYMLAPFRAAITHSGWLLWLVFSTLSMAIAAAICTRLTRRWQ